jgi:hypothetical protein
MKRREMDVPINLLIDEMGSCPESFLPCFHLEFRVKTTLHSTPLIAFVLISRQMRFGIYYSVIGLSEKNYLSSILR